MPTETESKFSETVIISNGLKLTLLPPQQGLSEGQIYHLVPATLEWNEIERKQQHRFRIQTVKANALIIRRSISPFIINSVIEGESVCIIYTSDDWIGYFNTRIADLIEIPDLVKRHFEEWPDRKMGATNIWVGPRPHKTSKKSSNDLDNAIKTSVIDLYSHRAVLRINFSTLNSNQADLPKRYIAALCVR